MGNQGDVTVNKKEVHVHNHYNGSGPVTAGPSAVRASAVIAAPVVWAPPVVLAPPVTFGFLDYWDDSFDDAVLDVSVSYPS